MRSSMCVLLRYWIPAGIQYLKSTHIDDLTHNTLLVKFDSVDGQFRLRLDQCIHRFDLLEKGLKLRQR